MALSSTYVWEQNGSSARTLAETVETATDGLQSWRILWNGSEGATNQFIKTLPSDGAHTETTISPNGSYQVATYQNGYLTSTKHYTSEALPTGGTTFAYDEHGRRKTATDDKTGAVTTFVYDNADRIVTNLLSVSGLTTQTNVFLYDDMGRVWRSNQPDGNSVTNVFYLTGELATNSGARTYPVVYTYDHAGRMKTMTTYTSFPSTQGASTTTWYYDSQGMLTNKTYANGDRLSYAYSLAGRLSLRTGGRNINTSYSTNNLGDVSGISYNDSGATPAVTINYNRMGRQETVIKDGVTNTLAWNQQGLLLSEKYSGGAFDGLLVSNRYDLAMQLVNVSVFNNTTLLSSTDYGYESGRMSSVTNGVNTATYSYWPNSSMTSTIDFKNNSSLRMTTSRTYDGFNRLTEVKATAGGQTMNDFDYAYNLANQRTRIDIAGANYAASSYTSLDYDTLGQITNATRYWTSDQSKVAGQQFGYMFDDIGNRKTTTRDGRVAEYANNNVNQITSRTVPGYLNVIGEADSAAAVKVNGKTAERKGTYYRKGLQLPNVTPLWVGITNVAIKPNGSIENYITNMGKVYVPPGLESLTHDADGNTTTDGRWTYTWDAENRLVSVETTTQAVAAGVPKKLFRFYYDWMGRRNRIIYWDWNPSTSSYKGVLQQLFVYSGWNPIAILTNNTTMVASMAWGTDVSGSLQGAGGVGGLLMMNVHTGANAGTYYYSYDGSHNVAAVVNAANSQVAARYEYGPFSESIRAEGPMASENPFRFSTKFQDDDTGFLYYGYRYYNPGTGRWISRDLIGEKGGANLFGFVYNNSINKYDYLGLNVINDIIKNTYSRQTGSDLISAIHFDKVLSTILFGNIANNVQTKVAKIGKNNGAMYDPNINKILIESLTPTVMDSIHESVHAYNNNVAGITNDRVDEGIAYAINGFYLMSGRLAGIEKNLKKTGLTCEQKYHILSATWKNFWTDYGSPPSPTGWGTGAYDEGTIPFDVQIGDVLDAQRIYGVKLRCGAIAAAINHILGSHNCCFRVTCDQTTMNNTPPYGEIPTGTLISPHFK